MSRTGRTGDERGGLGGDPSASPERADAGAGDRGRRAAEVPAATAERIISDAVEPQIRALLQQRSQRPLTVIAERIG